MSQRANARQRGGLRTRGWLSALVAIWVLASAAGSAIPPGPASDPWALISELREELRSESPLAAEFTQVFVPSGFSVGDTESGALYVGLPSCLRFEYDAPFPKNFLLCGDWVYTWNPGEISGRRFLANEGEAEGLELLRLEVDALRSRYRAAIAADDERTVIELTPLDPAAEIRSAALELARGPTANPADSDGSPGSPGSPGSDNWRNGPRLRALSYEDRSGNRTRFEIAAYRALGEPEAFRPPSLEWLED